MPLWLSTASWGHFGCNHTIGHVAHTNRWCWLSEKFEMVKFTVSLVKKKRERRGEKKGREKEKKKKLT